MSVIALVPMKGHSERVPDKNMKPFCGAPLYHYIVGTLQQCPSVEIIRINTDSERIAEDATKHFSKVEIVMRPEALRGDFVSMNEIIRHDMALSPEGSLFLQTHSTNPLLKTDTIQRAIEAYQLGLQQGYDSLFGVTRFQSRFYWANGEAVNHNPAELLRTQDLPPIYEENSNIYLFTQASFEANDMKRIGKRPMMFEINKLEATDIDEKEDFLLAETLYPLLK
jgi:CMP-N-acetylneuraminic acid synthetase